MSKKKDKKNMNVVSKINKPTGTLRKIRACVIIMVMKDIREGIARNTLQP
jgi:hypothetical protein